MTQKTVVLETGSLKISSANRNFLFVMQERTRAGILLGALTKLVVEHAVLFAPIGAFNDGVDAPILCLSDALPRQGVSRSAKHSWLYLVELLSSKINFLAYCCTCNTSVVSFSCWTALGA